MTIPKARSPRWLLLVAALFITCLITANIVAVKMVSLGPLVVFSAVIFFPVTYIFGDVLTEVYGYRAARRVIWLGFLCNLVAVIFIWLAQILPPAPFWEGQQAYERILGYTPRLLVASFLAYLVGEFLNSFVLARMKILTQGRWLWSRTISSTVVGQGADSLVFTTLVLAGTLPVETMMGIVAAQWLVKTAVEVLATPLTYAVVTFLKKQEGLDTYDVDTRFSPFLIRE